MKRLLTGITAVALVLCLGITEVFGAGFGRNANGDGVCNRTGGICGQTYRENRFSRSCHLDVNGDGICDFSGNHDGAGFTDADGDGICDNRIGTCSGKGHGTGHGGGHRKGCK